MIKLTLSQLKEEDEKKEKEGKYDQNLTIVQSNKKQKDVIGAKMLNSRFYRPKLSG